jgi:hypothetical protein
MIPTELEEKMLLHSKVLTEIRLLNRRLYSIETEIAELAPFKIDQKVEVFGNIYKIKDIIYHIPKNSKSKEYELCYYCVEEGDIKDNLGFGRHNTFTEKENIKAI